MLFHGQEFFYFMVALLGLVQFVPQFLVGWLLLAASYVFYGWSGIFFLSLLLISSVTDYTIARLFSSRPEWWKRGIALSALVNFFFLGYFKYSNFFIENLNSAFQGMGWGYSLPLMEVVLPVGISFYTFQSFAYTVDVLTGKLPACSSLPRFLLFVAWFPQLVAGPIMRAGDLLPQLENVKHKLRGFAERVPAAATLFAEGWLRKACADLVAPTANTFFRDPVSATGSGAGFGIVAFGLQIYGDFSGYTRMAQGVSWLFGVPLMENFDLPYGASGVRDFWRRWHISLSTWFRDYLYIPLGGNQRGPGRTYFNLAVTMLLCGFWHGASWTFLLWGAMHGSMLIAERLMERDRGWMPEWAAHMLTLVLVFLAWVPFRAPDLPGILHAYQALGHSGWVWPTIGFVIGANGLIALDGYVLLIGRKDFASLSNEEQAVRSYGEWKAASLIAACVMLWSFASILGQNKAASFIYFQF
jgi:alginate O-acetyltransferase complex protein AlgI